MPGFGGEQEMIQWFASHSVVNVVCNIDNWSFLAADAVKGKASMSKLSAW